MASSSKAPLSASARIEDYEFLYASNTNVFNFVSVKLSGSRNYLLWKAQMLCLLDSHNMCGIVDSTCVGPRDSRMRQYDSLVKGWIFGSLSEGVLVDVFNLGSAKEVWEKLKSIYDPSTSLPQAADLARKTTVAQIETKDADPDSVETNTTGEGAISIKIEDNKVIDVDRPAAEIYDSAPTKSDAQTETKDTVADPVEITNTTNKRTLSIEAGDRDITEDELITSLCNKIKRWRLRNFTMKGNWSEVESILKQDINLAREPISSDGSTLLHIAVGISPKDFLNNFLRSTYIKKEQVLKQRSTDGSTALHIAAIVGNKDAAELLVEKHKELLVIQDSKGEEPLHKACKNMHLDITAYLFNHITASDHDDKPSSTDHPFRGVEIGVELLANAISAKKYSLASELVTKYPEFATINDDVLMAIAKTFPPELNRTESFVYPRLDLEKIPSSIRWAALDLIWYLQILCKCCLDVWSAESVTQRIRRAIALLLNTVLLMLVLIVLLIILLIRIVRFSFHLPYYLLWKAANILAVPLIRNIESKKKEWGGAVNILEMICKRIDQENCDTHHSHYTRPILEAACQDAYRVVDEILFRSPEAIQITNESGYDIFQLAIMYRWEKIYNLIYNIRERRNIYRTRVDSSKNNILHLAGRLAPSRELDNRTGAALQLQRELQWFEEVKKIVFPTFITQENIFKETPNMVFRREHEKLLKEGEQWMKTTAESCSIAAALITTIVFAAAITVPGGSNQEKGTPLFKEEYAFTIFAIADAISLFASSTSLLVFLSILTARFAERDFLVSLPRRLFIGLFTLLLSTTAMMVAFSATLFLVFCQKKPWMLAPICGLAFIPIAFFVTLQFPLMVDLFRSTHIRTFGKQKRIFLTRFNPDDIRLFFHK